MNFHPNDSKYLGGRLLRYGRNFARTHEQETVIRTESCWAVIIWLRSRLDYRRWWRNDGNSLVQVYIRYGQQYGAHCMFPVLKREKIRTLYFLVDSCSSIRHSTCGHDSNLWSSWAFRLEKGPSWDAVKRKERKGASSEKEASSYAFVHCAVFGELRN